VLLAAAPADRIGSLVDGFESLGFCSLFVRPSGGAAMTIGCWFGDRSASRCAGVPRRPRHPQPVRSGRRVADSAVVVRVTTTSETVTTNGGRLDMGKAVLDRWPHSDQ